MRALNASEILARMQMAFDLYEAAEEIMRQNIRRRHPGLTEEEVEKRLVKWLQSRPDAPYGDAPGLPAYKLAPQT